MNSAKSRPSSEFFQFLTFPRVARHPSSGKYSSLIYQAFGRKSLQSLGSNDPSSRREFLHSTRIRHRQRMWRKVGDQNSKFKIQSYQTPRSDYACKRQINIPPLPTARGVGDEKTSDSQFLKLATVKTEEWLTINVP